MTQSVACTASCCILLGAIEAFAQGPRLSVDEAVRLGLEASQRLAAMDGVLTAIERAFASGKPACVNVIIAQKPEGVSGGYEFLG